MKSESTASGKVDGSPSTANTLLLAGGAAGAVGAAGAFLTGAVCPVCLVATPVLLGVGLVKKFRERRESKRASEGRA